ncbi:MAG: hypothetical protein V1867_07785 [Candidatus Falkowbacteria bacterium]
MALVLACLVSGIYPWNIFRTITRALSNNTKTINLYAGECATEVLSDNYDQGWWNAGSAQGEPETGPDEDILVFNDINSAFYVGGNYSLVCGGFMFIKKEPAPEAELDESADDQEILVSEDEKESGNHDEGGAITDEGASSEPEESVLDKITEIIENNPETVLEESDGDDDGADTVADGAVVEIIDESWMDEADTVDVTETDNDGNGETEDEIEVISEEVINATEPETGAVDEPSAESAETETEIDIDAEFEIEEVSWFRGINKFLSTPAVYAGEVLADEVMNDNIETLEDLGKFTGAKIKFSLALLRQGSGEETKDEAAAETEFGFENNEEAITPDDIAPAEDELIANDELAPPAGGVKITNSGDEEPDGGDNADIIEIGEAEITTNNSGEQEGNVEIIDFDSGFLAPEPGLITPPYAETTEGKNNEDEKSNVESEEAAVEESDPVSLLELYRILASPRTASAQNEFLRENAKIIIWYSLDSASSSDEKAGSDNRVWQELDILTADNLSNASNNGYFSYKADFLENWDDVRGLKLKFEGVIGAEVEFMAYLDSVWVEAEYESEDELDMLEKRKRWEEALTLLSEQLVFGVNEEGEMAFRYKKNENRIWDTLGEMIGLGDFWRNVDIRAVLFDGAGKEMDYPLTLIFEESGEFTVKLPEVTDKLKPGKYSIKFYITDRSGEEIEEFELRQDYSWGVLAMNFNKSVYAPGEEGYIQMAVLDESGHTICGSNLKLEIRNSELGLSEVLSVENGTIMLNPACGPESITSEPDYYAYYEFAEAEEYEFTMIAGEKEISETIVVADNRDFDIERLGPTRIYPKSDYGMVIKIKSVDDFKGDIVESVPLGFKISNDELRITNSDERDPRGGNYKFYETEEAGMKKLVWQDVELTTGDELEISYTFDAPDRSPELYLLGPLEIRNSFDIRNSSFEIRKWQIASDAVRKRARTVMFQAGTWNDTSAGGNTGQNTNQDYTFSSFNFKLAETGVDIKNAFLIFEFHYEAYTAVSDTNYSGYKLGFDACETGGCTLNPFTGTGIVLEDNNNVLSYDDAGTGDGESNIVRLLLDVSNESQLAAYSGGGTEYEGQVGYHFKNSVIKSSIASAKAVLILTYTYDVDSENITNTVVYPLDSTDGADRGSRVASIGVCTRDGGATPCPVFDYNMEIPEFPTYATSTHRLSQWFTMYDMNDGNGATDIRTNVNIQTYNVDSDTFHFESALGGAQSTMPAMHFSNWTDSGYEENSAQQLEYYVSAGTNFTVGGEVFETYIASSSAATSTRTASFPYGVINNGNTTSLTFADIDVYFPENGSATGTVKVKSAWVRIIPNHFNNGDMDTTVSTKVGSNATSTDLAYRWNAGTVAMKNSYNIINIIPSGDYAALEEANAVNPVTVRLNTTYNNADFGGVSAELMITYTYTDEADGYLTSLSLFGGQLTANPATSVNLSTADSVLPEPAGKTILGGALLASYLNSDSGGDVGAGTVFLMDANLSTGVPSCTNNFEVEPDDFNSYKEFYKDVKSALNTTDNQSYTACYSHDTTLAATDGAKMNGILSYTYGWENSAPTSSFIVASTTQKTNGSGIVDIGIEVDDPDDQDARARLEFATGTACVFSTPGDPILDETDGNITADFGDPYVENDEVYQVGTADGYVETASGSNSVFFDWRARESLGAVEGDYCLRLTANDMYLDQETPATTTVYIDTKYPTAPGALSLSARTGATTTLSFGATTTETNFREYKIYYQPYDGTDPTETDSVFSSSSDAKLGNKFFNGLATTSIGNLSPKTTYSLAIWAYDDYGNAASSSRVDIMTNDAPSGGFNFGDTKQRTDGSGIVDISIEVDDDNNDDTCRAKIEYVEGADCDFSAPDDPGLDPASITRDYGLAEIDNNFPYQIGTSSSDHWILTSPGSNTVTFDWNGKTDEPYASSTYCLRLTVNDGLDDQYVATTAALSLDNFNPTAPGILTQGDVTINSIKLIFNTAAPSADTNEPTNNAYRIFYKKSAAGVVDYAVGNNLEHDNAALDAYDYNGVSSTTVTGLDSDTWYYFNIWSYDAFGNKATSTEIAIKTNSTVANGSLAFVNPEAGNIAIAGTSTEWTFRVTVTETNGYQALASTTLRLADNLDSVSPFSDLVFYWDQTADAFYEIGNDTLDSAELSENSASNCAGTTCTLDFKILFNKTFALTSTNYTAEVLTGNDSNRFDFDTYADIFQVRFPYVEQVHYRWRNDDGGE